MKIVDFFFPPPKPRINKNEFQRKLDEVFLNEDNYIEIADKAVQRDDLVFAMEIYTKFQKKLI